MKRKKPQKENDSACPQDIDARRSILIVVSHLYPTFGLEKLAIVLARELAREFNVRIISLGSIDGITIADVHIESLGNSRKGLGRLLSPIRIFGSANRKTDDITILVGVWVAIPWLIARLRNCRRTIIWEHSLLSEKYMFDNRLQLLSKFAKFLYRRTPALVAVSAPLANDLVSEGHRNVTPINNPVVALNRGNMVSRMSLSDTQSIKLISIGSFNPIKRQGLIISALELLPSSVSLILVGDGPLRASLQEQVRLAGLQERVQFTGFLDTQEISLLLGESHFLVHAGKSETFGLVLVEAAEARVPVIATHCIATNYLISDFVPGVLTEASPSAIADAVIEINRQDYTQDVFAAADSLRDEYFSLQDFIIKWTALVNEVVRQDRKEYSLYDKR
ncbi:glycosyltransferase [Arthrobacter psychrochitiniphilus]|uniref:D-inositol 3-phosphate glycosyltransferase n=1 Tax=Arthrobacter psychrochitiniphilus TaxID=291045 RepID=A0A2V3DWQ4_9MICC|nr:glycosyltransferase [Arthrobacter psychrochitiniphilus]NYG16586.1 glycosyltransferase involved in cell wall biosynthesis [Arthrobacter psychrochitiniphilus]PXA69295.1 hypothetical protein CVS29_01625 [Arthrobacter psychrochitiniphilus]